MATVEDDDFELIEAPELRVPLPKGEKWEGARASDPEFLALLSAVKATADKRPKGPIFHSHLRLPSTTLYDLFLSNLPEAFRRKHMCHSCRTFVNSFGDLCLVRDDGTLHPLAWPQELDGIPSLYHNAISAITSLFVGANVSNEYRIIADHQRSLGNHDAADTPWKHFHVTLKDTPLSEADPLDTQVAYDMLSRVLADNDLKTIAEAHHFLHEKLSYSTSHKPAINWLQDVATKVDALRGDETGRRNLTKRYARTAWIGCLSSLRGGIIGALLVDVASSLEYPEIEAKWNALANPLQYLRPTAAPSSGNIANAEKVFEALGYTKNDMMRHFMTADQIPDPGVLWKDAKQWDKVAAAPVPSEGIFLSLKAKIESKAADADTADDNAHPTTISFRNFSRRVLPNVESMELNLKPSLVLAFFTSGAPNSKSPFAFGSETNTASWYYWGGPGDVRSGSLKPGWNEVLAIASFPHMWEYITATEALDFEQPKTHGSGDSEAVEETKWPHSRHGVRFLFCLKGAKETSNYRELCLFPTLMKGAFHGVRKTVEAFSASEAIQQPVDGDGKDQVGGLYNDQDKWEEIIVRVRTHKGITTQYKITLFD